MFRKEEKMGKLRSLTMSEWTAEHTLGVLRKMYLVPYEPHDCVFVGDIGRVSVKNTDDAPGASCYETKQRTIQYGWGRG